MAIQTTFSHNSGYRAGRPSVQGLILPEDFNGASGGNIQRPSNEIWTPEDGDGYSLQGGILQKDWQVYVPKKIYFLPSQVSVSAKNLSTPSNASLAVAPVSAPAPAVAPKQADCFNILDDLLLEEQQETAEQKRDMNWFGRLHEAVVTDINGERAAMGLPSLQDEAAKRRPDFH